ncbi:hypothetical protein DWX94_13520 [Coprococcus eutactus]|uniref:Uncharacterized protein n=1 Tax=Coprococcus eutactus TaxID=33043 RepID=A0A412IFF3_9FIRM|nr:hypothetical protein DWX94_13520 [Coprococcus eutactus]
MNKKAYVSIIIVLIVLVLITGSYTAIHYFFNYSTKEWFRESINAGDYVIVGEEIGDTIFDGDTQVEISIFDHINKVHMISLKQELAIKGRSCQLKIMILNVLTNI